MTITVLVPDELGVRALSVVDGVQPVRYRPGERLPSEVTGARVLVPGTQDAGELTALLDQLPDLEYVQLLSAGAERFIGLVPEHVMLSTCRGAHGGSTAEWVVGALLCIYREFREFSVAQQQEHWDRRPTDTLQGKRVLIVGAGDLGRRTASRLAPFEVTTTLVGRSPRDGVHGIDELPDLLGGHDAVVLVVPLTRETTGLVDADFLARMTDGAVLVNAARGPVVETDALVAELACGRLLAALDVTDPEPLPAGHPLWQAPGLLLTPHVGGNCRGLGERSWAVASAEIARFAAGEKPRNLVHGEY